nr:immunoglobulin light chain junction region [Macaca mulatta]MOX11204.1 immunoglobulin light chain junction region [Macaca mulatta]MOX11250.1 immunoglobulin light chain junction region [Macaca mulatta]MOX11652.1 immunoglobulin light chain junction region [Macaca mulatta]MOX11884.1 immunoglobulin light chain junction region [Macaca mulatta]
DFYCQTYDSSLSAYIF